MSFIFVKHFELPCVERCYINKRALPPSASVSPLVLGWNLLWNISHDLLTLSTLFFYSFRLSSPLQPHHCPLLELLPIAGERDPLTLMVHYLSYNRLRPFDVVYLK